MVQFLHLNIQLYTICIAFLLCLPERFVVVLILVPGVQCSWV